jgi:hypothetical protein
MAIWLGASQSGPAMTEYTVKEIGHQWIVYADRLSIGACADEDSVSKLIAEDSAANSVTRKSTVHAAKASIDRRGEPAVRVVATTPEGAHCDQCGADQAVVPLSEYENDRFIYVCVFCHRWGFGPLRVDFPPTDEITSKIPRKRAGTSRSKWR